MFSMMQRATLGFNRSLVYNQCLPLRRLKLHEYQAGALLHKYQVPIPLGNVAFSPEEARDVASKLTGGCVIKA